MLSKDKKTQTESYMYLDKIRSHFFISLVGLFTFPHFLTSLIKFILFFFLIWLQDMWDIHTPTKYSTFTPEFDWWSLSH